MKNFESFEKDLFNLTREEQNFVYGGICNTVCVNDVPTGGGCDRTITTTNDRCE